MKKFSLEIEQQKSCKSESFFGAQKKKIALILLILIFVAGLVVLVAQRNTKNENESGTNLEQEIDDQSKLMSAEEFEEYLIYSNYAIRVKNEGVKDSFSFTTLGRLTSKDFLANKKNLTLNDILLHIRAPVPSPALEAALAKVDLTIPKFIEIFGNIGTEASDRFRPFGGHYTNWSHLDLPPRHLGVIIISLMWNAYKDEGAFHELYEADAGGTEEQWLVCILSYLKQLYIESPTIQKTREAHSMKLIDRVKLDSVSQLPSIGDVIVVMLRPEEVLGSTVLRGKILPRDLIFAEYPELFTLALITGQVSPLMAVFVTNVKKYHQISLSETSFECIKAPNDERSNFVFLPSKLFAFQDPTSSFSVKDVEDQIEIYSKAFSRVTKTVYIDSRGYFPHYEDVFIKLCLQELGARDAQKTLQLINHAENSLILEYFRLVKTLASDYIRNKCRAFIVLKENKANLMNFFTFVSKDNNK